MNVTVRKAEIKKELIKTVRIIYLQVHLLFSMIRLLQPMLPLTIPFVTLTKLSPV